MARKRESEREREARLLLKQRHAKEALACGAFFDVADRRVALEVELAELENEEAAAVAALVDVSEPALVADMIGWSVAKVRAAAKLATEPTEVESIGEQVPTAADVA